MHGQLTRHHNGNTLAHTCAQHHIGNGLGSHHSMVWSRHRRSHKQPPPNTQQPAAVRYGYVLLAQQQVQCWATNRRQPAECAVWTCCTTGDVVRGRPSWSSTSSCAAGTNIVQQALDVRMTTQHGMLCGRLRQAMASQQNQAHSDKCSRAHQHWHEPRHSLFHWLTTGLKSVYDIILG
jgi:hypothetical protein